MNKFLNNSKYLLNNYNNKKTLLNKFNLYNNKNCYSFSTISTVDRINQRNQQYLDILNNTTSENISSISLNDIDNISRVLSQSKSISDETMKQYEAVLQDRVKEMNLLQLRKVMSIYVFHNKTNEFLFYDIKERYAKVKTENDYSSRIRTIFKEGDTMWARIFGLRNNFFKKLSCMTGLAIK